MLRKNAYYCIYYKPTTLSFASICKTSKNQLFIILACHAETSKEWREPISAGQRQDNTGPSTQPASITEFRNLKLLYDKTAPAGCHSPFRLNWDTDETYVNVAMKHEKETLPSSDY